MGEEAAKVMSYDREEFKHGEDGSNRVAWFLTGVLIGATVAILYAPKSGEDARQFLTDKTERGKEVVADKTKDIAEASRDMFERGRKVVEDAAELFDRARKLVRG
jgi:gas vesicle protein